MGTVLEAVLITVKVASLASVSALVVGCALASLLANRRTRCAMLVEGLILLPLVLPPTILGFYLLILIGRGGVVGRAFAAVFDSNIVFTPLAAVIAAAVVATPIMYKSCRTSLEGIEDDIIGAARIDGASELQVLLRLRLPLAAKGIVAGFILGFLRSIGEFGATAMVAGNIPGRTQTLSLALWTSVMSGHLADAHLYSLGLIALGVLAFALLSSAEWLLHSAASAHRGSNPFAGRFSMRPD